MTKKLDNESMLIDYAQEDKVLDVAIPTGSTVFVFPPSQSRVAATVCKDLHEIYQDEQSKKYLAAIQCLIMREGASVQ